MKLNLFALSRILLVLTVWICLAPALTLANPREAFLKAHSDFFHVYSSERTDMRLGYIHEKGIEEESGPGGFDLHDFTAELELPLPQSKDFFFRAGGKFEKRRYLFDVVESARTRSGSEDLYEVSGNPGFGWFLNDDLLLLGDATVGTYSDFDGGLETDDFKLYGKGMFVFRLNPGAQLILGASYSEDFSDQEFLPVIGIRLLSESGKVHVSVTAPFEARIGYYLTPFVELFGGVWASGDEYEAKVGSEELTVNVHDERLGGGLRVWLGKFVSITAEGGTTLESELDFNQRNAGQFTEGDLENGPYVRALIGLSL